MFNSNESTQEDLAQQGQINSSASQLPPEYACTKQDQKYLN